MARARNIKPGFFRNAQLVELGFDRRLLFAGLWTLADREGRLEDRPKQIKMDIFPADNVDVDKALNDLARAELIQRYESGGKRYIQIVTFLKHQNPHHKEPPSTIPKPEADPVLHEPETLGSGCLEHDCNLGNASGESGASPSLTVLIPDSLIPDSLQSQTLLSGSPPDGLVLTSDSTPKKVNGSAFYPDAENVLSYLNKAAGKGYEFRNRRGEITASAERIIGRLRQGYTPEELREVVHAKCEQWLHDERMVEYLRPATLFAKENFEQYLGELRGGNG